MKKLTGSLGSVWFWSVISAAFIGPGTVTTAASAGSAHGMQLLWALLYSTLACWLLQEGAARIPIATGYSLGEAIALRFKGPRSRLWRYLLAGVIILGGVAYQAGNLLGALAGAELLASGLGQAGVLLIGLLCGALLWTGRTRFIARVLGTIVFGMGLAFIGIAAGLPLPTGEVSRGLLLPQLPPGSGWLVIGLIGTTIVPYNLFLGSGLTHGQSLSRMRTGLAGAILLGGLISMAILVAGTAVPAPFSFAGLATVLEGRLGQMGASGLGFGLLAAGFSSSITAPWAAAVTASSLFGQQQKGWHPQGRWFRFVWGGVLLSGLAFALTGIKPVPAIVLAQALNGLLLPLVAIFLLLMLYDPRLMPAAHISGAWHRGLMLLVVGLSLLLGLTRLLKAAAAGLGYGWLSGAGALRVATGLALLGTLGLAGLVARRLRQGR